MTIARREILKAGAIGLLTAAGIGGLGRWPLSEGVLAREAPGLDPNRLPRPFTVPFQRPPVLRPVNYTYDDVGTLTRCEYELTAMETSAEIIPGFKTRLWGYNGLVPGPTVEVERGVDTVLRVRNRLPAEHPLFAHDFSTSTHLHGAPSLPQYDGYAADLTPPGYYKEYHYTDPEPARTLWYHDHAAHFTALNVYSGLAAQYHIHDRIERRLLPQGEFDVPLTVTDALFSEAGQLLFDDESQSGLYGDVILVNGLPWPVMKVQRRVYRFRFLAASVSRSYRFQLNGGDPVHIVATDSGLMPTRQTVTEWRQGTGERYEVLIDFSQYRAGQVVALQNLSNDNNRDYANTDKVMAFHVTDADVDRRDPTSNRIPDALAAPPGMSLTAASAVRSRRLEMARTGGEWTINDRTWADVESSGFQKVLADPGLGDVEVWDIENKSGGWFHPTHIHLVDFKILARNGKPPEAYELGLKDTAYVGENETVRVVARFGDPRRPELHGRYMVHCHNLVHEDSDMMSQFAVGWTSGRPDDNDPIAADPPKVDDLPVLRAVAPGRCKAPRAVAGPGRAIVEWQDPDDDGGAAISSYQVCSYAEGASSVEVTVAARNPAIVGGLTPGKTYRFAVAATNLAGTGPRSARSLGVAPLGSA